MADFPWATASQLWAGVPRAKQAEPNHAVGTFQLTSPTSVEPVFIQVVSSYADVLQNKTLDGLVYRHMQEVFPLSYTEEDLPPAASKTTGFYIRGDQGLILGSALGPLHMPRIWQ
mgnify:CR=1 FL=1